jgi:hypothetical protein
MAPTATTPRLKNLDPDSVAQEVYEQVKEHVQELAALLGVVEPRVRKREETILGVAVAALTRWAQTGHGMNRDEVPTAVHRIRQALYSRAAYPEQEQVDKLDSQVGDPDDAISCVLLAALARSRVLEAGPGKLVAARWLAALASVAESRVHQLAAEGTLRRVSSAIQTVDAKKWLVERGVPGFD